MAGEYRFAPEGGSEMGVTLPEIYTVLTNDNLEKHQALLHQRGKTVEQMRAVFQEGCLFLALPSGGEFEIALTHMADATSRRILNLMDLSLEEQERVRERLLGQEIARGRRVETIGRGGALFFRVSDEEPLESSVESPIGEETTLYYVTVLNGSYWILSLSDPSGQMQSGVVEQFETVFSSLDFKVTESALDSELTKLNALKAALWILSALGVGVVVWLVVSLAKEYHRRKRETEWHRKRRPKPRR